MPCSPLLTLSLTLSVTPSLLMHAGASVASRPHRARHPRHGQGEEKGSLQPRCVVCAVHTPPWRAHSRD